MNTRLTIIILFLAVLLVEFWSIGLTYNVGYREGRRDGIDEMVQTIDSIFIRRVKTNSNGMEK